MKWARTTCPRCHRDVAVSPTGVVSQHNPGGPGPYMCNASNGELAAILENIRLDALNAHSLTEELRRHLSPVDRGKLRDLIALTDRDAYERGLGDWVEYR